jgi:RNA polymerase sigma-70 factor (ECF subfamily)
MADLPLTRASLLARLHDPEDGAAWAEFVELYAPLVYGYARNQGLQDADAADLCQEVLSAVAVARLEYDPARGAFRNWLFTIVRRKLSNRQRAQRSRPDANHAATTSRLLEQCPAPVPAEEDWEAEWQRRLFAWACEQIRPSVTDTTWHAFWRTAVEDQPGKQVAADIGLSVAAVYRARSRVLARLRQLVQSVQE